MYIYIYMYIKYIYDAFTIRGKREDIYKRVEFEGGIYKRFRRGNIAIKLYSQY